MANNPAQKGNQIQLWTQYLELPLVQFPDFTGSTSLLSYNASSCFEDRGELKAPVAWFQVCVHAAEVWRQTDPAGLDIRPLPTSTIQNAANNRMNRAAFPQAPDARQLIPDDRYAGRYSALKARVTFTDDTAIQRVVEVDIGGGTTLSFCGSHVEVEAIYPEPTRLVPVNGNRQQLAQVAPFATPGIILDSWIQASAAVSPYAPIGRKAARNTVTKRIGAAGAAGVPMLFKIPPGAVAVELYASDDIATHAVSWVIGPLGGAPVPVAVIPAAVLATAGGPQAVNGTARWLQVDPSATEANVSAVWHLEY